MQTKSKLKKWGNSYGVIVPKEVVEREGLREGEIVEISVRKSTDVVRLFGRYAFEDLQAQKETMKRGWD
ncbi:MAG TPA: AbrB/MazE/SpoVT family DNA-binding domain-containing protein [Nitrososphaerales archaeon]|nr:AbrB/MazE/SpoVT family DNA-binding domain-containing protein [Nitrososphaerales archaeon]